MCSLSSGPGPKPEPVDEYDRYYRTSPVPYDMPLKVEAFDADRINELCDRQGTNPHMVYWWLWLLHLGREQGSWVGASWAMIDREVFIASPGVSRIDWLVWQLIRGLVFLFTFGRVRLDNDDMEVDTLSRFGMRQAFWTLVHYKMLERREETIDGLTMEIFHPTPRLAQYLEIIAYDPSQN